MHKLDKIIEDIEQRLKNMTEFKELQTLKRDIFSKDSELNIVSREYSNEKKLVKEYRTQILELFNNKLNQLKKVSTNNKKTKIDVRLPGRKITKGTIHPISQTIKELLDIFAKMGFRSVDGPELENVKYNFNLLNVQDGHPSRAFSDTFYIDNKNVLRTHVTNVQVRTLEISKGNLAVVSAGKVFRPESDSTHSPMFFQLDGFYVSQTATFGMLKWTMNSFVKELFGESVSIRIRPSYFPFTEPSAELDMECLFCYKNRCKVCGNSGWIELGGCGMISQNVLNNFEEYKNMQGFAFGFGIDRMAMLKYGVNDLREFYRGDLRFLKQF